MQGHVLCACQFYQNKGRVLVFLHNTSGIIWLDDIQSLPINTQLSSDLGKLQLVTERYTIDNLFTFGFSTLDWHDKLDIAVIIDKYINLIDGSSMSYQYFLVILIRDKALIAIIRIQKWLENKLRYSG